MAQGTASGFQLNHNIDFLGICESLACKVDWFWILYQAISKSSDAGIPLQGGVHPRIVIS